MNFRIFEFDSNISKGKIRNDTVPFGPPKAEPKLSWAGSPLPESRGERLAHGAGPAAPAKLLASQLLGRVG
jgi:hypothetical protein